MTVLHREKTMRCYWRRAATGGWLAAVLLAAGAAFAADEGCKKQMSARIQVCAEECRGRALAATDIKDPNNNILFGCIKKCAQDMALQRQVCS